MVYIKTDKFKKIEQRDKKVVTFDKLDQAIAEANTKTEMTQLPEPENWRQTDSVMVLAPGYWRIYSYVDARWRAEGKSDSVGGVDLCHEAKAKLEDFRKRFGKIPYDLRYWFEPRDLKKFKLASEMKK